MQDDKILYFIALPIILVAVFAEFWYRRNESRNTLSNVSSNLLCGLIDRLFFLFFSVLLYEGMRSISEFALFGPIPNTVFSGIVLFVVVDFAWYLYHRSAHNVKLLWTFHHTHHQTDDFNFSLGLRVSFLQQIVRTFFWLPIAALGFDPKAILVAIFFQSFYQFFLHTELFDFPAFTRAVFVSPQSHKLHHSNQKQHFNKNFGGVFIIWDKLFGTYQSPYTGEPITLSTTEDVAMLSPLHAYFAPFLTWMTGKKKLPTKGALPTQTLNGNRLFVLFLVLFAPSAVLIFSAPQLEFTTLVLLSTVLIVVAFVSVHLLVKRSLGAP
jgi:sterol desaturase/sphingolipid hydroxylase (fatty acid hydroxylase superfamily)